MTYKPCRNCAVEKSDCPRRKMVRQSIAGLGVTTINFKCPDRKPLFKQGQRVSLSWTLWVEPDDPNYGSTPYNLQYHATVLAEHRTKFIVRVDDMPDLKRREPAAEVFRDGHLVIKARANDLSPLDEPDRAICIVCAGYETETERCHSDVTGHPFDHYLPAECINKPKEAA